MSCDTPGEEFFHNLVAEKDFLDPDAADAWDHVDEEFDDDDSFLSLSSVENNESDGISDTIGLRPATEDAHSLITRGGAFNPEGRPSDPNFLDPTPPTETTNTTTSDPSQPPTPVTPPIPRGRSIAHHAIKDEKAVVLSLDVETAGERAGIIQISGELAQLFLQPTGKSTTNDTLGAVYREPITFNRYVNSGEGVWFEEHHVACHGIHPSDPRILNADKMDKVWSDFCSWIESNVAPDATIILVAYNGEKCEAKWLWKLTQAPFSPFHMPRRVKYFLDPYKVVSSFKSCPLNASKSKLDSYELGALWGYIHGRNLNGAHNSLVDAIAQMDVITSEQFAPFIDRSASISLLEDIFSKTQQNEWRRKMEPVREVHSPWIELTRDNNIEWEPDLRDSYTGPMGGGDSGPSRDMRMLARRAKDLSCVFLTVLPLSFFASVAQFTNKFAYKDFVKEQDQTDRDGFLKKKKMVVDCQEYTDGMKTPGARHRADNEKYKFRVTTGFVLAWVAILIIQGAMFGTHKPPSRTMWERYPFGFALPFIMNSMSAGAYEFMRRFIHFADNRYGLCMD